MEGDERTGNKRGRDDDKGVGRLEKRPSVVEEFSFSYSGDEMINGVKYEEEKETTTPTSAGTTGTDTVTVTVVTTSTATATATAIDIDSASTGLFDQLITNLVNSPRSTPHQAHSGKIDHGGEVADTGVAAEDGGGKDVKDGGGNENIIDNIVAKLPRTLSEDTGPPTDEASILIHSIIHD